MALEFGESASLIGDTASRPAADADQIGRYYADVEAGILYRDNGATWDAIARLSVATHGHAEADVTNLVGDLAGKAAAAHTHNLYGVIAPMTQPNLNEFAWVNQGGASAVNSNGAILLTAPVDANQNLRILKKAAPSTPYTITAWIMPLLFSVNYNACGLAFRQSSDGKLHLWRIACTPAQYYSTNYSAPNAFVSNYVTFPNATPFAPICMRIADNGTDRICSLSPDGVNFAVFHTMTRTTYLTADEVGFFAESRSAGYAAAMLLLSWVQA